MLTRIRLSRTHSLLSFLLVICVLAASGWGLVRASVRGATRPAEGNPSLGALLKPDGTLDLARGFQGGLKTQGYRMEYAANGAPRFVPAAPTTGGWDPQFVNNNGVQRVGRVVAASGTDVYVGGEFTTAGTTVVSNIAKWNGSTWSALGSGIDGTVFAIAVSGSDVYAGGQFTTAGGVSVSNIAKWNGSSWSALSSGLSGGVSPAVYSLVVSGSDVYAGGRFTTAGGTPAASIAKWNGSAWSALGSGVGAGAGLVYALAISGSNLYAGGNFSTAGGNPAANIAQWNGSVWSALGSGILSSSQAQVIALAVSGNDLYVGGQFGTAGGIPVNGIAKWNGSSWSALGSGVITSIPGGGGVGCIVVVGSNVYVGGFFDTAGGNPANNVAVWNGSAWAAMGSGLSNGSLSLYGTVSSLAAAGTDIYVAGGITKSGGTELNRIAKWNGSAWSPIGNATGSVNNVVYALAVIGSDVYVAGEFDFAGGVAANNIAKWNGSAWSALGSGLNLAAISMAVIGSDLYVGGFFTAAGGAPANYIARWNGSSWSPLGSGLNAGANAIVVSGTDLYVGGGFSTAGGVVVNYIARWNGSAWSTLGSGMNSNVYTLAVNGNDVYAGGVFTTAGGVSANHIAHWNGSAWSALGSGVDNPVYALASSGSDLYVGGAFTQAGGNAIPGLAKWNGSSWSQVGGVNGGVQCLLLAGSDLYVGGLFTLPGSSAYVNLAKWNGSTWSVLSNLTSTTDVPASLALQGANLFVGGGFTSIGGMVSHYFGRYNACVSSLTVNNTGDGADAAPGNGVCETAAGNGQCTLRAAIQEANALTACSPFTINFSVAGTINTATTLPNIVHPNLTISGPGANQLTVSAVPSDHQIFTAGANNINLNLSGLTITGGFAGAAVNAGAIEFNSTNGQLNLTACALIGNGGNVGRSQIYSNLSGGITITDSTISGNTNGYGITTDRTPLTLTNSTISGNAIYGIHVPPGTATTFITLLNCTIANNGQQGIVFEAFIGGGGTITTKNSIFAGSPSLQIGKGPGVTLVSQGNNLCSDATLSPTAAGDLTNTNPLLSALGNYGGPTPTLALLPGSPAINAGTASGAPANDQRGIARVGVADIGAFESRGFTMAASGGNKQSTAAGSAFANPLAVLVTSAFSEPVDGGRVTFTPPANSTSATIAGNPAPVTGGVAATGTVTANSIIGGPYTIVATANGASPAVNFSLTNLNSAPTFTPAAAIPRQQGSSGGSAVTVGTVNDAQTAAGSLTVTQIAGGTATGITVTGITNTNGTISAVISAACNAVGGTVRFQVSDGDLSSAANLTVNVTANAAPSLSYPTSGVALNSATTISPTAASDNGSITGFSIVSVVPPLTTAPTINASGVVSITNASPFGLHTITVRATDNCGTTTDASFTLNVGCGSLTVTPATLINGLTFVPYTSTLSASGGSGTYAFTLASGTLPAGLTLAGNTISGTPNTAGASTFTIRATDDNGCFGEQTYTLLIGSTGLVYYPLARPVRLLDTRPGASPNACFQPNAPIPGNTSRLQPARGTCEGLTIPANATTITGNITTVQSGGGFLTIYPSDAPQPVVANTNYLPNEVLNNAFTVGVGAQDGAVKIFVTSDTDVVVDVTGYYAPPASGGLYFHPLPRPIRLLETRVGQSGCYAPSAPLPGGTNTLQPGTGNCGGLTIPAEALALVGNATTDGPQGAGYLTLYPAGAAQPLVASSNYESGQTVNGPFTVGLSASGQFNIFTLKTTELVIDITGYYSAQASDLNGQGLLFTSLGSPLRLLDTRAGQQGCYTPGAVMTGGTVYTQETQSPCTNLTPTARALIGNATVVSPAGEGYLTFWPGDAAQPLVATSNYRAGQVFNRYFTVGLATDGSFKRFAVRNTHLVIDISGFFAP